MPTEPFSVRTDSEKLKLIDEIGEATDRSRNYLVNLALDRFLADEADFIADVRAGQEDVRQGRVTPHNEVFRKLRSKIQAKLEAAS